MGKLLGTLHPATCHLCGRTVLADPNPPPGRAGQIWDVPAPGDRGPFRAHSCGQVLAMGAHAGPFSRFNTEEITDG